LLINLLSKLRFGLELQARLGLEIRDGPNFGLSIGFGENGAIDTFGSLGHGYWPKVKLQHLAHFGLGRKCVVLLARC